MLDPSKPIPSSNRSSLISFAGREKCCQTPGRSTNRKSMILAPASSASFRTSFGVLGMAVLAPSERRRQRENGPLVIAIDRPCPPIGRDLACDIPRAPHEQGSRDFFVRHGS